MLLIHAEVKLYRTGMKLAQKSNQASISTSFKGAFVAYERNRHPRATKFGKEARMPAHSRQQVAFILATVGDLRSWVKQLLEDTGIAKPGVQDLYDLSEQLLSAATELTSLAIQVTQAAQRLHRDEKK
jgi:hypothetical protein